MVDYPAAFRLPELAGYNQSVRAGLTLTEMDSGRLRSRRMFRNIPHIMSASVLLAKADLGTWLEWINENGYDWFNISVNSYYANRLGVRCSTLAVRIISDLEVAANSMDYFQVSFQMEFEPDLVDTAP